MRMTTDIIKTTKKISDNPEGEDVKQSSSSNDDNDISDAEDISPKDTTKEQDHDDEDDNDDDKAQENETLPRQQQQRDAITPHPFSSDDAPKSGTRRRRHDDSPSFRSSNDDTTNNNNTNSNTQFNRFEDDEIEILAKLSSSKRPRLDSRASFGSIGSLNSFLGAALGPDEGDRLSFSSAFSSVSGGRGREWQSEEDLPHRTEMTQIIMKVLSERKTNPPKEWLRELPHKARRLERELYKAASSLESYNDQRTLKNRLKKVATAIANQVRRMTKAKAKMTVTMNKGRSSSSTNNTIATESLHSKVMESGTRLERHHETSNTRDVTKTIAPNQLFIDTLPINLAAAHLTPEQQQQLLLLIQQQPQQQQSHPSTDKTNDEINKQGSFIHTLPSFHPDDCEGNLDNHLSPGHSSNPDATTTTTKITTLDDTMLQPSQLSQLRRASFLNHSSAGGGYNLDDDDLGIQFLRETFGGGNV